MMQPPNRPKGEPAKTTIAMQEKQIEMLCQRVNDLDTSAKEWRQRCQQAETERDQLRSILREAHKEADYQSGYIARVRETDRQMFGEAYPPFPTNGNA